MIHESLATNLTVDPTPAGLHLVGWLQKGMNDRVAADAAGEAGVEAAPISGYTLVSDVRHGLVLGYAMLDEGKIVEGVEKLRRVLQKG